MPVLQNNADAIRWEPLGGEFGVYTAPGFRFGTDALRLADFTLRCVPRPRRMAELGTGCGVLPILWAQARPNAAICAIEIQDTGAKLAAESARRSGVSDRVQIICGDLRTWTVPPAGRFDAVAVNPPYFPVQSGAAAADDARRIARSDESCTLDDAAQAAARILTGTGWLCMVLRAERLADAFASMRRAGLEPKRMQLVQADLDHPPKLALIGARRNARPGMKVECVALLRAASRGNVENPV